MDADVIEVQAVSVSNLRINLDGLLHARTVESERIEFKATWDQRVTLSCLGGKSPARDSGLPLYRGRTCADSLQRIGLGIVEASERLWRSSKRHERTQGCPDSLKQGCRHVLFRQSFAIPLRWNRDLGTESTCLLAVVGLPGGLNVRR